jgi:hypothetical protein
MRKLLRVVMMGFASVLKSAFPPMTALSADMNFLSIVSCLLTIIKSHLGALRSPLIVRVEPNLVYVAYQPLDSQGRTIWIADAHRGEKLHCACG